MIPANEDMVEFGVIFSQEVYYATDTGSKGLFLLEVYEDDSLQTMKEVLLPKKVKINDDSKSFTLAFSIKTLQGTKNHQKNVLVLAIDGSLIQNKQG